MTLAYDDVWVREPRLMVPRKVPIGNVKIDWNNPLTKELKHCVLFNKYRPTDLLGNKLTYYTFGSYMYFGAGQAGPGLITSNQGGIYVDIPMFSGVVSDGLTIFVHQHAPVRNTDSGWLRYGGANNSHYTYSNAIYQYQGTTGNPWSGITDGTHFDFEEENVICMTSYKLASLNRHCAYVNGKKIIESIDIIDFVSYPTYAHLCGCQSYAGWKGITYSVFAYRKEFSAAEAAALSFDPYQFLIPA